MAVNGPDPISELDFSEPDISLTGDDAERLWSELAVRSSRLSVASLAAAACAVLALSAWAWLAKPAAPEIVPMAAPGMHVICHSPTTFRLVVVDAVPPADEPQKWLALCGGPESTFRNFNGGDAVPLAQSAMLASGTAFAVCRTDDNYFEVMFGVIQDIRSTPCLPLEDR